MKSIKIFAVIAAFAAAGTTSYFISSTGEEKVANYNPREQKMKIRHTGDLNGAAEYYTSLRKNIHTGKVEIDDILFAQQQVKQHAMKKSGSLNMQWEERGPDNVGGRTRAILVDRNNSNRVFAGSVSGGLFVSNDAGSTWNPVDDQFENLIVSSLAQAPDGSIWMGTGSDFDLWATSEGILFPGNGLYRSPSGAKGTWTRIVGPTPPNNPYDSTIDTIGITKEWVSINRIAFKPGNSNEIYVAMNRGLRVSTDGGQTWINPIYGNPTTCSGPLQQVRGEDLDVTSDGRLFVSIDGVIYYSDNPSVCSTWVKIPTTVVPKGKRTEIAVAPSNPNYVYACLVNNVGAFQGVWKSTDKGVTWTQILSPIPGVFEPMTNAGVGHQGVYDLALEVAPNNPDKIFIGGIQLWRYDGNLTRIAIEYGPPPYYVHADKHYFAFSPNNPNIMYIGSDGGISKSFDQGSNFFTANKGYNVTQFYAGAFGNPSAIGGKAIVMGGSQDNGTQLMTGTGINPLNGDGVLGGDGFDCDISSITGALFGTIYGPQVFRSTATGGTFALISSTFQDPDQISVFNSVIRLWESKADATSRAKIIFKVDTTGANSPFSLGTGTGSKKIFTGTITPIQPSAKLVIGSLRIQAANITFMDWENTSNSNSTFYTRAFGIISIDTVKGSGNISSVKINSVNQITGNISYTSATEPSVIAANVANAINSFTPANSRDYTAKAIANKIYVFAPVYSKDSVNNQKIITVSSAGTLVKTDTATLGGGTSATNKCTINYTTGAFNIEFANAPSPNTPIKAFFTTSYTAGSTLYLASNTEGIPVTHTINQNMNFGDSVVVQDPIQSLLAVGVHPDTGGIVISRSALDFKASIDTTWMKLNLPQGTPSCIEFSPDGNHMFAGTSNGIFRFSGLNNVYWQRKIVALTATPAPNSTITVTTDKPHLFSVGDTVNISGIVTSNVKPANGNYAIDSIISDTKFTYKISNTSNLGSFSASANKKAVATTGPLTVTKIYAASKTITGIAIDHDNPNNVVFTTANYGVTDHVYLSTSALTAPETTGNGTFVNVSGDLPYMPVYDAEFINHSSKVLLGTEFGVYSTNDIFANPVQWTSENNGKFPHMPVYEVRQQKLWPSNNYEMIYIATHGRGIWESSSLVTGMKEPPAETAKTKFLSDLRIYPNPMNAEGGMMEFNLQESSSGNIRIYDLNGRNIVSMLKQPFNAGTNRINLETKNLSIGTYFVTVEAGSSSSVGKFVVIK